MVVKFQEEQKPSIVLWLDLILLVGPVFMAVTFTSASHLSSLLGEIVKLEEAGIGYIFRLMSVRL